VDAVAPGPPAHDDDGVAGAGFLGDFVARDQPNAPAEHERVAEVLVVEIHGPVDGRDAHAVAVVAHAGDDLLEDALRVDDAFGERVRGRVQG
jgi:hypothetical protein